MIHCLTTGFELDEQSSSGDYSTVATFASSLTSYSITNPAIDPDATYYLSSTYSDPIESDPADATQGICPPMLQTLSAGTNCITLEYDDPSSASLTLYEQGPDDGNSYANTTVTLDTSPGEHSVTVTGLSATSTYYFHLDAFTIDQDVVSGPPIPATTGYTPPSDTPTITSISLGYDDGVYTGDMTITYETSELWFYWPPTEATSGEGTSGGAGSVVLSRDDDPFHGLYQSYPEGNSDPYGLYAIYVAPPDGGEVGYPSVDEETGDYIYNVVMGIPASDQVVNVQIALENIIGDPTSAPVPVRIPWLENGPATPTLSATADGDDNLDITATGGTADLVFFAVTGDSAVQITSGITTSGDVHTLSAGSPYIGDPIFAVNGDADDPLYDGAIYYSGDSNVVNGGDGTVVDPTNLTTTMIGETRAFLHWQDNADDETGYEIDAEDPHNVGNWLSITTVPSDCTSFLLTSDDLAGVFGESPDLTPENHEVRVFAPGDAPATAPINPSNGKGYFTITLVYPFAGQSGTLQKFKQPYPPNIFETATHITFHVDPRVVSQGSATEIYFVQLAYTDENIAGNGNWHVDFLHQGKDDTAVWPFYSSNGGAPWINLGHQSNPVASPAWLSDSPDDIGTQSNTPIDTSLFQEFETAAVVMAGKDIGWVYGALWWGAIYHGNTNGNTAVRWISNTGNFSLVPNSGMVSMSGPEQSALNTWGPGIPATDLTPGTADQEFWTLVGKQLQNFHTTGKI